jgi:SMI1 / KNR4 family (SUKH-1)
MTVEERIDELAETLRQLCAEDTELRVFGAPAHGYRLNPPLSEAGIKAFEADHGITLPEEYRRFLRVIGDGGPGPAYGLLTLAAAAESVDPRSPFPFAQASSGSPDDVLDRWSDEPFGVLELCDHGCAIYSYLVVNGPPHGTIWNGSGIDVQPTELGFLEWYRQWADASLRKVRSERRARVLRVGMSTDEVIQAVEGAWKKRQSVDGTVTWFEAPGIPAQLEMDEHDRVARIIPWQFL